MRYFNSDCQVVDLKMVEGISVETSIVGDEAGRTWTEHSYQVAMKSGAVLEFISSGLLAQYKEYMKEAIDEE